MNIQCHVHTVMMCYAMSLHTRVLPHDARPLTDASALIATGWRCGEQHSVLLSFCSVVDASPDPH